MAATALVSLQEYLATSYRPDVEYVDGELRPKGGKHSVVQWTHSNLQFVISGWFYQRRKEWRITGGVETRTRVFGENVRLPDVVIDRAGAHPEVLTSPPLIVIEILSPSTTLAAILERFHDFARMGVANIWLIDPQERTGQVYDEGGLLQPVTRFEVAATPIYLDLPELFASIDEDNA